ncbi:MAG: hypothetical protein FD123_1131 [Bacteroidetes bacterium]|nr:MAG: hypothetical protein FD123_1131 [Bacteroidota bacterium]
MEYLGNIPNVLYKYRDWDKHHHQRLLTHRELFFPSADMLNDYFEGMIPFRYKTDQLTADNIFLKQLEMCEKNHPDWDKEKIHEFSFNIQQQKLLFDENHIEETNKFISKTINDEIGILSLSSKNNSQLMWGHYSNSQKGYCVGFDKHLLFQEVQGCMGPIQYQDELPLFDLFGKPLEKITTLLFTKPTDWGYEQEYRITKWGFSRKTLTFAPNVLKEIVLGARMSDKVKVRIVEIANINFPHASIFELKPSKTMFNFDLHKII